MFINEMIITDNDNVRKCRKQHKAIMEDFIYVNISS